MLVGQDGFEPGTLSARCSSERVRLERGRDHQGSDHLPRPVAGRGRSPGLDRAGQGGQSRGGRRNPLEDIGRLASPSVVIQKGRILRR